ncbi:MAG: Flp family type IVb pilin [Rhizobiaceae bacterium]
MTNIVEFLKDESGATAIEYGLAAALVSIVAIIGMVDTGQEVNNLYTNVEGAVSSAAPAP